MLPVRKCAVPHQQIAQIGLFGHRSAQRVLGDCLEVIAPLFRVQLGNPLQMVFSVIGGGIPSVNNLVLQNRPVIDLAGAVHKIELVSAHLLGIAYPVQLQLYLLGKGDPSEIICIFQMKARLNA